MLLRESGEALGVDIDLSDALSTPPAALPAAAELAALTEALTSHPTVEPVAERAALLDAVGDRATERAVAVCATFNLMNRMLDGTGTPIPSWLDPLAVELGFEPSAIRH